MYAPGFIGVHGLWQDTSLIVNKVSLVFVRALP